MPASPRTAFRLPIAERASHLRSAARLGAAAGLAAAAALGCSSGALGGESWVWKRPCGTAEQLEADRQACVGQTVGVVDPSGRGSEYGPDLFRECMESRGWQRVAPGTVIECK